MLFWFLSAIFSVSLFVVVFVTQFPRSFNVSVLTIVFVCAVLGVLVHIFERRKQDDSVQF